MSPVAGNPETLAHLVDQDTKAWYQKPNLRRMYYCLIPAAMGVEWCSGFDGSIMNGLQAVDTWAKYFNEPKGAILGVMSSIYNLGALSMMVFVPMVSDRWGRRSSIVVGNVIMMIGAVIQATSVNLAMFIISRFILGMGIPFALSGGSQLIGELAYHKERPQLTSAFNVSWYVGGITAAGVTLGTFKIPTNYAWRIPSVLQIVPSLISLAFIWGVPESPRWLISKGREEEALAILIKYHGEGDVNSAYVAAEYAEMVAAIHMEQEQNRSSWKDLFSTKPNLKRCALVGFIGLFSQFSGNGLVSYYLSLVLDTVGVTSKATKNQINLGLNCWNLLTGTAASYMVGRTRRRTMYLFSVTGMFLCFCWWTAASAVFANDKGNNAAAGAVIAAIFVYYLFYNSAPLTYTYTIELFPTLLRAKGTVVVQTFSRTAAFFNTFVNPIGLQNIQWRFYIVYVVWLFIEGVIIFFTFPETKGKTLEELAFLFEDRTEEQIRRTAETKKQIEADHGADNVRVDPSMDRTS